MSSLSSSFSQSSSSDVEGFFFRPGTSRTSKKIRKGFFHQALLDAGEMHVDDLVHGVDVGKLDVVEEAQRRRKASGNSFSLFEVIINDRCAAWP